MILLGRKKYEEAMSDKHPHTETSPLICSANQWTDFFMTETSAKKKLMFFM